MAEDPIIDSLNPMPKRDEDREERIRRRAFALWDQAGRPGGREMEHWFAAEREIDEADREAEQTASIALGTPLDPDRVAPDIRDADTEGLSGRIAGVEAVPKTAGAAAPDADTSKSPLANRNLEGGRKAGTTPRPTDKPIVGGR